MSDVTARLQRLEKILEISRDLTSTTSLKPLLQRILEAAAEVTDSESAGILLLDEAANELRFVAASRYANQLADIPVPIQGSIAGEAFLTGKPLIVTDVEADPRYYRVVEEQTGYKARSLLAVPLQFKDHRIGVLEAENKRGGKEFKQEDVDTLTGLAAQATVAIENARLVQALQETHDELEERVTERTAELTQANVALREQIAERVRVEETLRRRNRELALLNRAGQELTVTLDLKQVAEQLLQATTEIIGAEGASVWLWETPEPQTSASASAASGAEEQQDWLICWAASYRGSEQSPVNVRLPCGVGIVGTVAQTGESAVVPYAPDDPRFYPGVDKKTGLSTISLLAVPLWVRGKVLGVLEVVNKRQGTFNTDDRALVETLAASAAIAIDNGHLVEALRQYAFELEARNEDLNAFAHTVAHDLKNPLNLVIGFTEVLVKDIDTMPDADLHICLSAIVRNGRKMNNILYELLLLAGVRQMDADLSALDMASVVAEALQRLDLMIAECEAQVVLPDAWPVALGYGPWIEEVWINYASNAIKYGGRPPLVEFGATPDPIDDGPSMVRFWVRDNGAGIPPEARARLFKPFTRLDHSRVEGHGLGLSIARRIVEKLGGRVGVESGPGQGSTFFFTLPAA